MRRARLLLSAIAVLAVVGIILAFKAKEVFFVLWTANAANQCTRAEGLKTTVAGQGQFTAYYTTTGPQIGKTTCTVITNLIVVEN